MEDGAKTKRISEKKILIGITIKSIENCLKSGIQT